MPSPKKLKVNDKIVFVSIPKEWERKDFQLLDEDKEFMLILIKRKRKLKVTRICDHGHPWIDFKISINGEIEYHSWAVLENTGRKYC
jgi:hypothetical protein